MSTRKKRILVFLHIGANKTGTSAIQKYCNTHREALATVGLLYPQAGCSGEAHYRLSDALGFSHVKLGSEDKKALQEEIWSKLIAETEGRALEALILSSENFTLNGDPITVKRYFSGFDVRIVVYLRRHDSWWPSAFNQAVRHVVQPKWGWGVQEYVKWQQRHTPRYGDWRYLVDRWAAVFGKESIIVRPYEQQQNQPNIVADFFGTIGRPELAPAEALVVNESLDAWSLRMIDIAQRAEIDEASRRRIIDHTLRNPKGGAPLKAPAAYLRQLVAGYAEDYAYIAREYMGREDGRLFYDPLPKDGDDAEPPLPAPREVMAWTVRALTVGKEGDAQ